MAAAVYHRFEKLLALLLKSCLVLFVLLLAAVEDTMGEAADEVEAA